jgi:serine/threonine-protein kinase
MTTSLDRLTAALADRYRLDRELGQGGMATVYLAHDRKHDRDVAIKVLHPDLGAALGGERFLAEIRTTARLQHPHILPLLDSGDADGLLYYVMPLVTGETLRARLDRERQLPITDAVRIAREVASALDYAHRQNVIHRDIKPENILLHDGQAIVADFGIALAVQSAGGTRLTQTGLSLGTPQYMSPEQAMGERTIDARSDLYALGAVTYEMLVGDAPFTGGSVQAIVAKVLSEKPTPMRTLRDTVPPQVEAAVFTALANLPADRFESAKAFADALTNPAYGTGIGSPVIAGERAASPRRRRTTLVTSALMVLAIGAAAAVGWTLRQPPARQVVRFPVSLASGQRPSSAAELSIALSPDGSHLAYVAIDSSTARHMLYLRALDQLTATALPGTKDATTPFFSPDGLWIGFVTANGDLKKVPATGGPVSRLATGVERSSIPSWGDDHRIVYHVAGVPTRIADGGGAPAALVDSTNRELRGTGYVVLPGGRAMLWRQCGYRFLCDGDLAVLDLTSGTSKVLIPGASGGWYLSSGHLVYATREGALFAVTFDLPALKATSTPVAVLDGIQLIGRLSQPAVTVSASGSLAYVAGGPTMARNTIVQVDRTGREETIMSKPGAYQALRLSPDGRRLAFHDRDAKGGFQLWVHDFTSATSQQLTFEGNNVRPAWSPDGRRLAFATQPGSAGFHIESIPSDGSGPGAREGPDMVGALTPSWTRDGQWIVFNGLSKDGRADGKTDIFAIPMSGATRTMRPAVAGPSQEGSGEVSPDGKWIAYVSDETGKGQVYVQPFLAPGARTPISTGSASEPVWLSNNELVYRNDDAENLTQARLAFGATITVTRTVLFDARPYVRGTGWGLWRNFDVSRDGGHFIMAKPPAGAQKAEPIVVLNWGDEVKRLMAAAGIH